MEVDGQTVPVMTEKVRRRVSKWDVEAERHVEAEIRIDNTLPEEVDNSMNLKEPDFTKPSLSRNIDDFETEISASQSGKVSDDNIMHSHVLFEMPQGSKQTDLEGDCIDGFKNQGCEHVSQEQMKDDGVENQSGKLPDSDVIHSDVLCEMAQHPEHIDLGGDCKDGFKKQDWEHVSEERTLAECAENQEKPLDGTDKLSPGPDESHQWINSISPTDVRSRSDRKRSRSRSKTPPYDSRRSRSWSRTKSPSSVYKQGSERSTDTGRTRGTVSPSRDFSNSKQFERHDDSRSTYERGSRIEKPNYSRENFSRRSDAPLEDGRGNNELHGGYRSSNRCFDFARGRCHRGASCRYIHDDAPSDGGWNARDESRGKVHDRRGGTGSGISGSFSHRHEHHRGVSHIPCKFFLDNACRRGESCNFSHQVKPANTPNNSSIETQVHDQSSSFAPPIPLKGQMQMQMQPIMTPHPQNLQNQFPAFHQPPNSHFFSTNMQNQPSLPLCYELNTQNPLMQSQNLNGSIQQIVPGIHVSQGPPDFNVGVQILPNLASQQNIGFNVAPLPSPNPQNFNFDEKNRQLLMGDKKTSGQKHIAPQVADLTDTKASQNNTDDPITNKVVTIEQAAKIVDLSASLAQFFGTAGLSSQSTVGMTPHPFLNSGPFVTNVGAPLPTQVGASQARPFEEKPRVQRIEASTVREVKKTEAAQVHKEQPAPLVNDDEEGRKNGDSKKNKESKDIRMFKCALIEFVKDMLKPKWKEGQLSKEAHKTIVKKVVDKVSVSLQGLNVPQTQEKIDLYLESSKPKLSKLVQAYMEKYVKS